MKISFQNKTLLLAVILVFTIVSCKKDDDGSFHQISALETQVHNRINNFRESKGLNTLVLQPIMFEEARIHSDRMANGVIDDNGEGIDERFAAIKEKIGGTSQGWIILSGPYNNADSIVNHMISDTSVVKIITREYTQSGVGISYNDSGMAFITHLFLNIPDKK